MIDFMGFPREVRDMIYARALCVDGVIAPYKEKYVVEGDYAGPAPTVALLAVSTQLRDEALPVLYGKNTWRVNALDPSIGQDDPLEGESDETYTLHLVTYSSRVNIRTVWSSLPKGHARLQLSRGGDRTDSIIYVHTLQHQHSSGRLQRRLHNIDNLTLTGNWIIKSNVLSYMSNLTSILINIANLFCPMGCCRLSLVRDLFELYLRAGTHRSGCKTSPTYDIRGVMNEQKEEVVNNWLQRRQEASQYSQF